MASIMQNINRKPTPRLLPLEDCQLPGGPTQDVVTEEPHGSVWWVHLVTHPGFLPLVPRADPLPCSRLWAHPGPCLSTSHGAETGVRGWPGCEVTPVSATWWRCGTAGRLTMTTRIKDRLIDPRAEGKCWLAQVGMASLRKQKQAPPADRTGPRQGEARGSKPMQKSSHQSFRVPFSSFWKSIGQEL